MKHCWVVLLSVTACARGSANSERDAASLPRELVGDSTPRIDLRLDHARVDLPASDPFHDLRPDDAPHDLRRDNEAVDLRRDTTVVDLETDQATVGPCAAGGTVGKTYADPTMVICEFPTGTSQCDAVTRCTGTWHMCTATDYRTRGGASEGHSVAAWIASCVRTEGTDHAPADGPCASCDDSQLPDSVTNAWRCGTQNVARGYSSRNLGVITAAYCYWIGLNQASTGGYWMPWGSNYTQKLPRQVVCCK